MKPRILLRTTTVLLAVAVSLLTTPLSHAEETVDDTPLTATLPRNALEPEYRDMLARQGVDGDTLTIQQAGGFALVSDGKAWLLRETPNATRTISTSKVGAGVCAGKFFLPKKVNANVEWGAQNSCATLGAADVHVHSIAARLRMQTGTLAFQKSQRAVTISPQDSVWSETVTAHSVKKCDSTTSKQFQVEAQVTLKSIRFDPIRSDNVTLQCNLK